MGVQENTHPHPLHLTFSVGYNGGEAFKYEGWGNKSHSFIFVLYADENFDMQATQVATSDHNWEQRA